MYTDGCPCCIPEGHFFTTIKLAQDFVPSWFEERLTKCFRQVRDPKQTLEEQIAALEKKEEVKLVCLVLTVPREMKYVAYISDQRPVWRRGADLDFFTHKVMANDFIREGLAKRLRDNQYVTGGAVLNDFHAVKTLARMGLGGRDDDSDNEDTPVSWAVEKIEFEK